MELRFHVSDDQIQRLQECAEIGRAVDVARQGIDLLDWATQEINAGRRIVAIDTEGNTFVPVMGVLNRAQGRRED